jgi:SAM-dependent methyltransferase
VINSFLNKLRQLIGQDVIPRFEGVENRLSQMEQVYQKIDITIEQLKTLIETNLIDVHGSLKTIGLEIYDHHNLTRSVNSLTEENARLIKLASLYELPEQLRVIQKTIFDVQSSLNESSTLNEQRLDTTADLVASRVTKTTSFIESQEKILHQINYTNHNLYLHLREAMRVRELYYRDMMLALDKTANIYPKATMNFTAEKPVAIDTDDHLKPWGAAHDNTRLPRFAQACERHFGRPLTFLDLGCSGGGMVLDFILRGHRGFGVEGSDNPLNSQRSEWRVLKNNLFTADITRPFKLADQDDSKPVQCDVISMWEVMEHIADEDLEQLFANILAHLKPDGIFVGSIALGPDDHGGASYHRTVKPQTWWEDRYKELGMKMITNHDFAFEDFARGTSNGPIDESYRENPGAGFHFVAVRKEFEPVFSKK